MYANALVTSKFGPMIVNVRDQYIGNSIITSGAWNETEVGIVISLMTKLAEKRSSLVFYDVGANVGAYTLPVAKHFGDKVRVRSFEAQTSVFQMLCGTVALNNLDNVDCHLNAVSNVSGEMLTFSLPDYNSFNNFGGLELLPIEKTDNQVMVKSGKTQTVTTVTVDDFNEPVSFMKMDIEGMEHLAIQGARRTIETHLPAVFCELHKTDGNFVVNYFQTLGYSVVMYNADGIFLPPGLSLT